MLVFWHLGIGRSRKPGPGLLHLALEMKNVGVWPTHGDLAMEAHVDFLAVVEHRLISARVRGDWTRLKGVRVWRLSGLLLPGVLTMLVMLGLVSSA